MINIALFNDPELRALREHQRRIVDRDKDKRRRAMKEYRAYLDYLESTGRISAETRTELEHYRMDKRHL